MKNSVILLVTFVLISCGVGTSSTPEPEKKESDMIFGKSVKETYVIASPMEGVLMKDGKLLANTKITRRLRWNGNEDGLVEEFMTNDQGRFSLPIHEEQIALGILGQFVSSSKLEVEIDGEYIDVWYNNKFEAPIYAETDGQITGLVCDLSNEEIVVQSGLSKIMTVCRWANMPESEI